MRIIYFLVILFVASSAWASSYDKTHTFTGGTTAVASQVNANFDQIETAVDNNDAVLDALLEVDGCTTEGGCELAIGTTIGGVTIQTGIDDDEPDLGDFSKAIDLDFDGNILGNAVAMGADTTGDFVASVVDSGTGEVIVTGTGEQAAVTLAISAAITRGVDWNTAALINAALTSGPALVDDDRIDAPGGVQSYDATNTVDADWDTAAKIRTNFNAVPPFLLDDDDIGPSGTVQGYNSNLTDLADGTLSASAIDSTITRDTEWDSATEINTATVDEDFVLESEVRAYTFDATASATGNCNPGDMWATGSTDCLYICTSANTWGACKQ